MKESSTGEIEKIFVLLAYPCCWWLLLLLFGTGLVVARERARASTPQGRGLFLRKLLEAAAIAALATIFCTRILEPRLRVFLDEPLILLSSRSMYNEFRPDVQVEAIPSEHGVQTLAYAVDKRPPLFPFLIHAAHWLKGYSPENVFLINQILFFLLIALTYSLMRTYTSFILSCSAIGAMCLQPILFLVSRSGAFDLLGTVLIAAYFHALRIYVREASRSSFRFLLMISLLVLYGRYEWGILPVTALVLLRLRGLLRREHARLPVFYIAIAIGTVPLICQRLINTNLEQARFAPVSSWYYFILNNTQVLQAALSPNAEFVTFSAWVFLFVLSLILFFIPELKTWRLALPDQARLLFDVLCLSGCGTWCVITALHLGLILHGMSTRYFLPHMLLFSLALPCFLFVVLSRKLPRKVAEVVAAVSICALLPVSYFQTKAIGNSNILWDSQKYYTIENFLRTLDRRPDLVVNRYSQTFLFSEKASISFRTLGRLQSQISKLLPGSLVLIVQDCDAGSGSPLPGQDVPGGFILRKIQEWEFDKRIILRLSALEEVR